MRAIVNCFLDTCVLSKALTILPDWEHEDLPCEAFDNIRNMDRGIEETPIQEKLQNPTPESGLAPIIAPVVTRKGKQGMLQSGHSPPFQESRPSPPTAPPGEILPSPPPVTPL